MNRPLATAFAVAWLATGRPAGGYENGAPPGHTGGFGEPDCHLCHSDSEVNAKDGSLRVDGLPAAFEPGATYELIIVLQHPSLKSGGFQLAIRDREGEPAGEWQTVPERLQIVSQGDQPYLQHARADRETGQDGSLRWTATWRAPTDRQPLVLHVAANASNDDLSALGDLVYIWELSISGPDDGGGAGEHCLLHEPGRRGDSPLSAVTGSSRKR